VYNMMCLCVSLLVHDDDDDDGIDVIVVFVNSFLIHSNGER
jgi:hypothetical protein